MPLAAGRARPGPGRARRRRSCGSSPVSSGDHQPQGDLAAERQDQVLAQQRLVEAAVEHVAGGQVALVARLFGQRVELGIAHQPAEADHLGMERTVDVGVGIEMVGRETHEDQVDAAGIVDRGHEGLRRQLLELDLDAEQRPLRQHRRQERPVEIGEAVEGHRLEPDRQAAAGPPAPRSPPSGRPAGPRAAGRGRALRAAAGRTPAPRSAPPCATGGGARRSARPAGGAGGGRGCAVRARPISR